VYRCHLCGAVVPSNTPAYRKVLETRRREYPFRKDAHLFMKDGRPKKADDPGGVGFEIVREVVVCPECFEEPAAGSFEGCGPPVWAVAA
jgi:rubredoxin